MKKKGLSIVIRTDKDGVQKIRANEIVPGDLVEVSGGPHSLMIPSKLHFFIDCCDFKLV
jgi:hypothetical protein